MALFNESKKLITIQKREKLNNVYALDELGNGGANHMYAIVGITDQSDDVATVIDFQNGPRNAEGSKHGVLDVDLLEIVKHRLTAFQAGPYACEENDKALQHITEALLWMNKRVEDRIERNILGKNEK